jgi:hypothetical protein
VAHRGRDAAGVAGVAARLRRTRRGRS